MMNRRSNQVKYKVLDGFSQKMLHYLVKGGLMLSYFIVLHDNETFFELNDEEWRVAVKEYPQLLNPESKLPIMRDRLVVG